MAACLRCPEIALLLGLALAATTRAAAQAAGAESEAAALRTSGLLQVDSVLFEQSSVDQLDPATGEPLNQERFAIRRARVRVDGNYGYARGLVQIDANTLRGGTIRLLAAELSLGYPRQRSGDFVEAALGLFFIPFGLETTELANRRMFMEASRWVNALFPGRRDLGARVQRWSFCVSPRSLSENAAVAEACARDVELGPVLEGELIDASLPRDACARFGPETSAGLRPGDPDLTGGYYQPLRLTFAGETTLFRHRIRCALANAPLARAQEFEARYRENRHPDMGQLTLRAAGGALDVRALPLATSIELEIELAPDARERYARFDARSGRVVSAEETLNAAWYATAGQLAHEQAALPELAGTNLWHSPEQAQTVWLWVVVRDDRGGVATRAFELRVGTL